MKDLIKEIIDKLFWRWKRHPDNFPAWLKEIPPFIVQLWALILIIALLYQVGPYMIWRVTTVFEQMETSMKSLF